MLSRITVEDANGRGHIILLDHMEITTTATGPDRIDISIRGTVVADPAPVRPEGPNQIVSTSGQILGKYADDEKWERQR